MEEGRGFNNHITILPREHWLMGASNYTYWRSLIDCMISMDWARSWRSPRNPEGADTATMLAENFWKLFIIKINICPGSEPWAIVTSCNSAVFALQHLDERFGVDPGHNHPHNNPQSQPQDKDQDDDEEEENEEDHNQDGNEYTEGDYDNDYYHDDSSTVVSSYANSETSSQRDGGSAHTSRTSSPDLDDSMIPSFD